MFAKKSILCAGIIIVLGVFTFGCGNNDVNSNDIDDLNELVESVDVTDEDEETATEDIASEESETDADVTSGYDIVDSFWLYDEDEEAYIASIEIINTSSDYLSFNGCEVVFLDSDGEEIKSSWMNTKCFPTVLEPGENAYVVCREYDQLEGVSDIRLSAEPSVCDGDYDEYDIVINDIVYENNYPRVCATITNNTEKTVSDKYFAFITYDSQGKIISVNGFQLLELEPGQSDDSRAGCFTRLRQGDITDTIDSVRIISRVYH